jgi:hypothetical protein
VAVSALTNTYGDHLARSTNNHKTEITLQIETNAYEIKVDKGRNHSEPAVEILRHDSNK